MSQVKDILHQIDRQFAGNAQLQQLEARTGLPKSYIVLSGAGAYAVLTFLNIGGIGQLLSNIAGFVVPGYLSLNALETSTSKDDTQLLTYWVVFAFLNVLEFWSKAILYWIPLYWFIKTCVLLYLAIPQTGGAVMVYNTLLRPVAQKYVIKGNSASNVADDLMKKANTAAEGHSTGVSY